MLVTMLFFFHSDQVAHFAHHAQNLGSRFVFYRIVEFFDAERRDGRLLASGAVDGTAYLGDDDFCHDAELIR